MIDFEVNNTIKIVYKILLFRIIINNMTYYSHFPIDEMGSDQNVIPFSG